MNWWNAIIQKLDSVSTLPLPFGGCVWKYTVSDDILMKGAIATRSCAIIADALVVTAIWTKTVNIRLSAQRVGSRRSLSEIIVREGALYFGILFLLNLISVVLDHLTSATFDPIPSFIDALTSILTSRLMLKLREYQRRADPMADETVASIKFSPTRFDSEDSTAIGMDTIAFSTVFEHPPQARLGLPELSKDDVEIVSSTVLEKSDNPSLSVEEMGSLNIEECQIPPV